MEFLSLAIGFLAGTATGAAGSYFGLKYTDERRKKEAAKDLVSDFNSLWDAHPDLLTEMKQDLENSQYKFHREFFVLKSTWSFNHKGPFLAYYLDKHQALDQQIRILEERGYVRNVTVPGKNVEKYLFDETFVKLLKERE
jgi:hypothetical protein